MSICVLLKFRNLSNCLGFRLKIFFREEYFITGCYICWNMVIIKSRQLFVGFIMLPLLCPWATAGFNNSVNLGVKLNARPQVSLFQIILQRKDCGLISQHYALTPCIRKPVQWFKQVRGIFFSRNGQCTAVEYLRVAISDACSLQFFVSTSFTSVFFP